MAEVRILTALGTLIEGYASNIFAENGVSAEEAALIMEAVAGRFTRRAHEAVIMSLVQKPPEQPEEISETGTVEDLKRALDKVVTQENCAAE